MSSSSSSKSGDPRLGSVITPGIHGNVVLIGFPYDEGCGRNGGRRGAAESPQVFRNFLQKMGPVQNAMNGVDLAREGFSISDAGDVKSSSTGQPFTSLEEAHIALEAKVLEVLMKGGPQNDGQDCVPFVIGGSNDQSAPNGRALLTKLEALAAAATSEDTSRYGPDGLLIVNVDAHFDVRPKVVLAGSDPEQLVSHSGSPFRELLEDPRVGTRKKPAGGSTPCHKILEFAAQSEQCSAAHANYVKENDGHIIWMDELREKSRSGTSVAEQLSEQIDLHKIGSFEAYKANQSVFMSFDIDAVAQRDCPGVSCPANYGLSAEEAMQIGFVAGQCLGVKLMDLSELNTVIEGYVSPRLAVLVFYWFVMGVCKRLEGVAGTGGATG